MDLRGGCRCGAVRYAFDEVVDAGYCHCGDCRRATGAPVAAWVVTRGLRIEGEPRRHKERGFCATCGTALFAWDGDRVEVQMGSLDTPIAPRVHRHVDQQLAWVKLDDRLPAYEGGVLPDQRIESSGRVEGVPPRGAAITLREITEANLRAVLFLDVEGGQRRLVATNAISLAQAYFAGDAWHRAIYAGDVPIGFVMAAVIKDDGPGQGEPNLWRFLIDERFQRRGFGGRALAMVIAELATWAGDAIWLACVPGDGGSYALYRSFGFEDTGVVDSDGERVMRLPI